MVPPVPFYFLLSKVYLSVDGRLQSQIIDLKFRPLPYLFVAIMKILHRDCVVWEIFSYELAGISRVSFLNRLAEFKISIIDKSFYELQEDLKNA